LSRNWLYYTKTEHLQQLVMMNWFSTESGEVLSKVQKLMTVHMLCCYHLCHTTSDVP